MEHKRDRFGRFQTEIFLEPEKLRQLYLVERRSMEEIARLVGFASGVSILQLLKKFLIPRRTISEAVTLAFSKNLNLSPTPDLAYVLGVLKGDGWVYSQRGERYMLGLDQINKEFAESFETALKKLGLRPHTYARPPKGRRKKVFWTYAHSAKFVRWYRGLTIEDIENLLGNKPELIKAFIRGFYESEGSNFTASQGPKNGKTIWGLEITSKDPELITLVERLLVKIGFNWGRCGDTYNSVYRLRSRRRIQNSRFLKEISPCIKNLDRIGVNLYGARNL